MEEKSPLLVETREPVAIVTLNRPEKRNALSRALLDALHEAFDDLAGNEALGLIVLRGAGSRTFAAGGDLVELESVRTREAAMAMADHAKGVLDSIRRFPAPVVAALNGDALGGGAELALACDFRVAANHARIGFLQGRLNITTGWGGGIDLMRLLGKNRALSLLYSTRLVEPREALAIGMIDAAAGENEALDAALDAFIGPLLERTPRVLRALKRLAVSVSTNAQRAELDQIETEILSDTWVQPAHWEAARRALAK